MTSDLLTSFIRKFYTVFERTIQGKLKAEYVKYELRYDILNLDKFGAQERDSLSPPPPTPL